MPKRKRTTIELPDTIRKELRQLTVDLDRSMKSLIIEALIHYLETIKRQAGRPPDPKQKAAPELYKRLKNMVREWEIIVGPEDENSTPGNTLEKAKQALALAEGREIP